MLGSAAPATATIHTTTTPASPTRPSRLRGLSYLRSYTHQHLHGNSSGSTSPRTENPPSLSRTRSTPAQTVVPESAETGAQQPSSIQNGENGWFPTSGLRREAATSTSTDSAQPETGVFSAGMTRSRAATAVGSTPAAAGSSSAAPIDVDMDSTTPGPSSATPAKEQQPTIRFIPHMEARSSRPSLHFSAITRTLKSANTIVRVGRYSERDTATADANTLPVGFKSKVVSRRHCEFWCTSGQWYVKDVKSSSGTFLNHVRLSSPGIESRPYPINDGDVVQLGIDFKGGEEVIFRCVKIRIECNRGWQKSLNNFNTSTHKRLLKQHTNKQRNRDSDAASVNSSECSICLNPVAPCQALFVAPCSHVWHYKCVRNLIHGPSWPNFLCPNCRFVADLDADVEPDEEEEEEEEELLFDEPTSPPAEREREEEGGDTAEASGETGVSSDDAHDGAASSGSSEDEHEHFGNTTEEPTRIANGDRTANITDDELAGLISNASVNTTTPASTTTPRVPAINGAASASSVSSPVAIGNGKQRSTSSDLLGARSATPTTTAQFALSANMIADGPMTPRNDAGPFVLDGAGGRERHRGEGIASETVEEESEPSTSAPS